MQLKAKTDAVVSVIFNAGHTQPGLVADCVSSPNEYGYRNCVDFVVSQDKTGRVHMGISCALNSEVMPIKACQLLPRRIAGLPKSIAGALGYLFGGKRDLAVNKARVRVSRHRDNLDISLWTYPVAFPRQMAAKTLVSATRATSVSRVICRESLSNQNAVRVESLSGASSWVERVSGISFYASPASPFPHNTPVAEKMITTVAEITNISQTDRVLEIMPGAMAFGIPLSISAGRTIAIESRRLVLRDLAKTAEAAESPIEIVPGDIEYGLEPDYTFDTVIVHSSIGISPQAWRRIIETRPRLITHHTNELSVLSKDAGFITQLGYTLKRVIPFDVSPHTTHIETMALFERM